MAKEVSFVVHARLPRELEVLDTIARNLVWSWDYDAIDLFRRIDPNLWEAVGHNPIRILGEASQQRLDKLAEDPAFLAHIDRVREKHDEYLNEPGTWYSKVREKEHDGEERRKEQNNR